MFWFMLKLNSDLPQETNVNKIIFDIVSEVAASFEDGSLKWLLSKRKLFKLSWHSYGLWSNEMLIYIAIQEDFFVKFSRAVEVMIIYIATRIG